MNNTTIGTRIAELRKATGEKQEDLAEVLGCNRGSLANYETGKRTPDIETIIKIAQHYETTTDYILGVTDNKTVDTTVQAISDYTGLSDHAIEVLRLFNELKQVRQKIAYMDNKHEPVYYNGSFNGIDFDTFTLSHRQIVYEIDFLDWYLRKMYKCSFVLEKIVNMVNLNHVVNTDSKNSADNSDIMDIICRLSSEAAELIASTSTIVTGIQYREFLIDESKTLFGRLLGDFSVEYSPFEEYDSHHYKFEKLYVCDDLKAKVKMEKTFLEKREQNIVNNKDGDT